MTIYVIENDGHNELTMHKFRDFEQCAQYLGDDFRSDCPSEDEFNEWEDDNCVSWVNYGERPDLDLTDHTGAV